MQITLPSGTPAELVRPSDAEPRRGLVLIPDIMGLRPLFVDHARRIADEQGWAVCSFELWPGREDLPFGDRLSGAGSLSDERVLGDAVASADALGVEPVGVTGVLHRWHVHLEGRGHRALRPGRGVLRPHPGAGAVAQPWPR
jgi:carboxymethylenebutenolidase